MSSASKIYCMTGAARAGKDTSGKVIAKKLGYETYSLAKPIKDVICALFNWGDEHRDGSYKEISIMQTITPDQLDNCALEYYRYKLDRYEDFQDCWDKLVKLFDITISDDGIARCVISPRVAFQLFGTEWGRSLCDTIWLDVAPKNNVVILDVRFDNEAQYFKNLGGTTILVKRPHFTKIKDSSHDSEKGVKKELIDLVILNETDPSDKEKSMKQLENKIDKLLNI